MKPELAVLERARSAEAAALLGRAFVSNPSTLALLAEADEARRLRVITRVMRGFVEGVQRSGRASAAFVDGRLAGVSLAYAPGQYPAPARVLPWLALGPISTGPAVTLRYALAQHHLGQRHPAHAHYYLFVLGVDPNWQGHGIGTSLLAALSERADAARVECYLETDTEPNVRLYRRHGYRVTHFERAEALQGLRFWTMSRPAR